MIRFDRVTIQLGTRRILDEEDFRLHLGMPHIILGESGSGKTPVLKVMLGLIRPRTGSVYLNGIDIASLPEKDILPLRQKVAMVFQSGALFDSLTVGENVGYRLFEAHRDTREVESIVREKLHLVGLEDAINLYPAELSGGMAKRVAMARALAASPEVILFDEPTEGLDPIAVYNLNRFSILKDGKFLFQGTRDELEQTENEHIQDFRHPTKVSLNEWASGQAPGQLSVPIGPG